MVLMAVLTLRARQISFLTRNIEGDIFNEVTSVAIESAGGGRMMMNKLNHKL